MSVPLGEVSSSALRLAVVGPSHPYKGGVAAHTTTLAHHLAGAGHDVTLVSWSHLYPSRLYPGEQAVPGGAPDVPPFPRTVRALSWARPDTWVRAGRRLRGFDAIIVVHVIPPVDPGAPGAAARRRQRPALDRPRAQRAAAREPPRRPPADAGADAPRRRRAGAQRRAGRARPRAGRRAGVGRRRSRRTCRAARPPSGRRTTGRRGCSPWAWSASTRASTCCCGPCSRCPTSR